MTRVVDYSSWVISQYRLMQTMQECQNCGNMHEGSVASEVYVVSERGRGGQLETRSDKLSVILARYAYYLGGKPGDHRDKLPAVPCGIETAVVKIEQCPACFNTEAWCTNATVDACLSTSLSPSFTLPNSLLPAEPLDNAKLNKLRDQDEATRVKQGKMKPSRKANPKNVKAKPMTLDQLMKDL